MSEQILTLRTDDTEPEVEMIADELTDALNTLSEQTTEYKSEGENVGWRNVTGSTTIELRDGRDLLRKLLPNTPCTAEFTITEESITVELSHHDSPTGETHTITAPATPTA